MRCVSISFHVCRALGGSSSLFLRCPLFYAERTTWRMLIPSGCADVSLQLLECLVSCDLALPLLVLSSTLVGPFHLNRAGWCCRSFPSFPFYVIITGQAWLTPFQSTGLYFKLQGTHRPNLM
ncbi:hypothetical protein OG21DRAFT_907067 [Imleria badia]|nr:hypothetical protein OG21DRAFT_907067 [Imleria badia]